MLAPRKPVMVAALLLAGLVGADVRGQCAAAPEWSARFGPPGLTGPVNASTVFDDGTGPALYVGGAFSLPGPPVTLNIARWNGSTLTPVGAGLSGSVIVSPGSSTSASVSALAVYDDGSGPALFAGGVFQKSGSTTLCSIGKWNGTSWSALGAGLGNGTTCWGSVNSMAVHDDGTGPALYVAGWSYSPAFGTTFGVGRWNGTSWSSVGGPFNGVSALASLDDGTGSALYAFGSFPVASAPGVLRWNGSTWSVVGSGSWLGIPSQGLAVRSLVVHDDGTGTALYAGGTFSSAGGVAAGCIARWNGTSWSELGGGVGGAVGTPSVNALCVFDDGGGPALYVGGEFTFAQGAAAQSVAKWFGGTWSALGTGIGPGPIAIPPAVRMLGVFDDGRGPALYAGGRFLTAGPFVTPNLGYWKDSVWSQIPGEGAHSSSVPPGASLGSCFATFDDGSGLALYAGGQYNTIGGATASRIGRWNGKSWSGVGGGIDSGGSIGSGRLLALASFDDGSGPALYAGGDFTMAGTVPALGIARWNGTMWSPVGSGTLGIVRALAVFDDGGGPALYAGGDFLSIGGVSANFIAKWNGTSWSALSTGMNNTVRALAVFDDGTGPCLHAGGNFTTAGGVAAHRIAKWNGAGWAPLGVGFTNAANIIDALAVFDDGGGPALFAGGLFFNALGVGATCIAKWNGAAWSALDGGTTGEVLALAVFDDGNGPGLYAGGDYLLTGVSAPGGAIVVSRIARWNGSAWSALTTGIDGTVRSLGVFDDGKGPGLFVAGDFSSAGGKASSHIARWAPARPTVMILQQSGPGTVTHVRNADLVVGHEYYNLFSLDACAGATGGGPYLGLCYSAGSIPLLVAQLTTPLETPPFHVLAGSPNRDYASAVLPPGLVVEAVCFDFTLGVLGCYSGVDHFVAQ